MDAEFFIFAFMSAAVFSFLWWISSNIFVFCILGIDEFELPELNEYNNLAKTLAWTIGLPVMLSTLCSKHSGSNWRKKLLYKKSPKEKTKIIKELYE